MAQKVKKKYIENAAVDASKILFLNDQTLQAQNAAGSGSVDIFKVNAQNKIEFLGGILSMAGTDANSVVVKSQMESAISAERVVREAAEKILQDNINAEAALRASEDNRILSVAEQYSRDQDVINLAAAKKYCDDQDVINLASAQTYADTKVAAEAAARLAAVNAESAARVAADNAEIAARQAADNAEAATRLAADNAEIAARQAADTALGNRLVPIETRSMYGNSFLNNDSVVSGGVASNQPGVEDPSALMRDGWYYANSVAGQGVTWYFYDKNTAQSGDVQQSAFSAYAVMTFDAVGTNGAKPIIGIYSYPTGSGDAAAGFYHSKWVYQLSQTNLNSISAGKKVLLYIGANPSIHPELQHISLDYIAASSAGPRASTEVVGFANFCSDPTASVNKVKWMVESLGVETSIYSMLTQLRIRYAQKANLDSEVTNRTNADSALSTRISSLESTMPTKAASSDLTAEINNRISAVSAEASARSAADALLLPLDGSKPMSGDMAMGSHKITGLSNGVNPNDAVNKSQLDAGIAGTVQKSYVDAQDTIEANARAAADLALSNRVATLELDPVTKSYVNGLNSAEIAARQAADSSLSNRVAVLELDPITKTAAHSYVDGKISDLINGAPAALDTLKEIADQLGNDENAVNALTNTVAGIRSDLTAEVARAQTAEHVELTRAQNAEASLRSDLNSEISRAEGIESGLRSDLNSEVSRAEGVEASLRLDLNSEVSRAEGVEAGLRSDLNSEIANAQVREAQALADAKSYADQQIAAIPAVDLDPFFKKDGSVPMAGNIEMGAVWSINNANTVTTSYLNVDTLAAPSLTDFRILGGNKKVRVITEGDNGAISLETDGTTILIDAQKIDVGAFQVKNMADGSDPTDAVTKQQLDGGVSDSKSYADSVVLLEKSRAEGIENSLRSDLNAEILNAESREAQVLLDAKAYSDIERNFRISDVNGLDVRLSVLEEDPTTKSYVDGLNSIEKAARIAGDHALDLRVSVLEQDPTTKNYVDMAIAGLASSGGGAVQQVANDLAQEIANRIAAVSSEATSRAKGDSDTLDSAKSYADSKISALVNSAPGMLDTLKELADAIGDDPNFAATVASQVNDVHNEVIALKNAIVFHKEAFVLSSADMAAGYIEMAYEAAVNSMNAFTDGLAMHEGIDYHLSVINGKTRLSFDSMDFAAGDKVFVQYFSKLA